MTLEVCCGTAKDVENAVRGGADRIELCSALSTGGLTPSVALIRTARRLTAAGGVTMNVLIRPREGDFVYDDAEKEVMLMDIAACKEAGADGVVIGALTGDNDIDMECCRAMIAAAAPMHVTFSRAFDLCGDKRKALRDVKKLGCDHLLTSGGAPTALEGVEMLRELVADAGRELSIIAASGINTENFGEIVSASGVKEIHGSLREAVHNPHTNSLPGLEPDKKTTSVAKVKLISESISKW